jgi:glycosyltransferase involved in cell wall biosynthesis
MVGLKLRQRNSKILLIIFSFVTSFVYGFSEFIAHFLPNRGAAVTDLSHTEKPRESFDGLQDSLTASITISIIIPVYNSAKTLKRCLDSVVDDMDDSVNDVEVIIINDGSPDDSEDIVQPYLEHEYFVYFHQKNSGLSGARNTGIKRAKGEYLFFLDSDDQLKLGAIKMMRDFSEKKADLVQFSYAVENGENNSEKIFKNLVLENCSDIFENSWSGFPWGKLIKKELMLPFGFPEGFWFEDTVFPAIVFPRVNSYVLSDFVIQKYFINPNGITVSAKRNVKSLDHYRVSEYLFKQQKYLGIVASPASVSFWREHLTVRGYARIRKLSLSTRKTAFAYFCGIMTNHPELMAENGSAKERIINLSVRKHLYFLWQMASFLG